MSARSQVNDSIASKISWLLPLKMSDVCALTSIHHALMSARAADENRDRLTQSGVARPLRFGLCSGSNPASAGNSDNRKGRQYLPQPEIARDDTSASPQRPASSRVLPFPAPVEMSGDARLRLLDQYEPESASMIRRLLCALSDKYVPHAS
jgi:hypothetical protein